MKRIDFRLILVSVFSFSVLTPAMDEGTFERALQDSLKRSPLTATQKARHVLNRMGYGGNPLSEKQHLDRLNTDEEIIHFVKEQLENLGSPSSQEADDVFAKHLSTDPKAICEQLTNAQNKAEEKNKPQYEPAKLEWCREGLTPKTITGKTDVLAEVERLRQALVSAQGDSNKDKQNEILKEKALTAVFDYNHLALRMYHGVIVRQVARAILEEKKSFHNQLFDFWFNHFNVSLEKVGGKGIYQYTPVIENNLSGKFSDMLFATAQSPQMLLYLENYLSGRKHEAITKEAKTESAKKCPVGKKNRGACIRTVTRQVVQRHRNDIVINENYARELIELHTFGEGPGVHYFQHAVQESAKILSGWSVKWGGRDEFQFNPAWHVGGKKVLFVHPTITINEGGKDEGDILLRYLAYHPVTARNISKKLVNRFVSEKASLNHRLVNQLTRSFVATQGDLPSLYRTLLSSPEFWSAQAFQSKAVRPFDRHVRMVRAMGIQVDPRADNYALQIDRLLQVANEIVTRSNGDGQSLFRCLPPTGYPDDSSHWLSLGSMVRSVVSGFKAEDVTVRARALESKNPAADSWYATWHFFLKNGLALSANSTVPTSQIAEDLNRRFDYELLTGRAASDKTLHTSKMDKIRVGREYQLLPTRTEMTLHFGSEQASKY